MMVLTTVSAFFATYLVRSGVIDSVHAFGDGSVGTPLTIFVLGGLVIALWIPFATPKTGKPLAGLESREGFLTLVAWVLLALAVIILVATMGLMPTAAASPTLFTPSSSRKKVMSLRASGVPAANSTPA